MGYEPRALAPTGSGAALTGVTKASGLGAVDIVSVADPSLGGNALPLISGVAGGDEFLRISDAGNIGTANETRFGVGAVAVVESEAFGFNATAVSGAVAFGNGASALSGVAIGWSAYSDHGVAFGYNTNAVAFGVAIGVVASAVDFSVAIGPYTNTGDNGVAIGRFAACFGVGNVAIGGDNTATLISSVGNGFTDTVQLGRGSATVNGGLHFRGFNVLGSLGFVNTARLGTGTANATTFLRGDNTWATTGTVTNASIVTANGVSGTVANPTTTPEITLILGAITPTSVNGVTITNAPGSVLGLNGNFVSFNSGMQLQSGVSGNTFTFPSTSATIARTDAAQTFTGVQSFATAISLGSGNTISALGSHAFGIGNAATALYAGASGSGALASIIGQQAYANQEFSTNGDAQITDTILKAATSGAVSANMTAQGAQFVTIPGKSYACTVTISARKQGGLLNGHSMWIRTFIITNDFGTVIMDGSVRTLGTAMLSDHNGLGASVPVIIADNALDSIRIDVTGVLGANIRWVADIHAVEIGY